MYLKDVKLSISKNCPHYFLLQSCSLLYSLALLSVPSLGIHAAKSRIFRSSFILPLPRLSPTLFYLLSVRSKPCQFYFINISLAVTSFQLLLLLLKRMINISSRQLLWPSGWALSNLHQHSPWGDC